MKDPRVVTKMANSAMNRATELLNTVKTRLESPSSRRRGRLPARRVVSADRINSNMNNAEANDYETSSMQTTSTSSSAHSGFLNFSLPTTVNVNDPLPLPTCRLGPYQVEWTMGNPGSWRVVTENANVASFEQNDLAENDLPTMKRINKALRKERELLRAKLSYLYQKLAKQSALVNHNEKQLEKLRAQVKQRSTETPEGIRVELHKALEQKLENSRVELGVRKEILTSEDDREETEKTVSESTDTEERLRQHLSDKDLTAHGDPSSRTMAEASILKRDPEGFNSGKNSGDKKPRKENRRVSFEEHVEEEESDVTLSTLRTQTSKDIKVEQYKRQAPECSDRSESETTDHSEDDDRDEKKDASSESQTNSEVSTTATAEDSAQEATDQSSGTEESNEKGDESETLEEEEETEQEESAEEEEISKTDESETSEHPGEHTRVVQFGKVSKR